jgi:hypothetical protein
MVLSATPFDAGNVVSLVKLEGSNPVQYANMADLEAVPLMHPWPPHNPPQLNSKNRQRFQWGRM